MGGAHCRGADTLYGRKLLRPEDFKRYGNDPGPTATMSEVPLREKALESLYSCFTAGPKVLVGLLDEHQGLAKHFDVIAVVYARLRRPTSPAMTRRRIRIMLDPVDHYDLNTTVI